jgi:hypothetical protein
MELEASWECAVCGVTVRWMPGFEPPGERPPNWTEGVDGLHCLGCRRDVAAEAALAVAPEDSTPAHRAGLRSAARVDFEVRRDPDRADGNIARACRSSVQAVQKSRRRLGVRPHGSP